MTPATGCRQLDGLADHLSERDWAILADLECLRLYDSTQVRRLHFTGHANTQAGTRATNKTLRRLAAIGLIAHLDAQIGGVHGGSRTFIWHLTAAGQRLLARRHGSSARTVIRHEPTTRMVAHTLAATETATRLREQATAQTIELFTLETEPSCWRDYLDPAGGRHLLKPDLFSITAATGSSYEQLWFIEIDLATESVAPWSRKPPPMRPTRPAAVPSAITASCP